MKNNFPDLGDDTIYLMFSGLTSREAEALQKVHGTNALPTPKYRFLFLVIRQFKGFFNVFVASCGFGDLAFGRTGRRWFYALVCNIECGS